MAEDETNGSEETHEAPRRHVAESSHEQEHQSGGGGNFFMHKLGPLPLVAWLGVGIAAFLVYRYIKNQQANSSSTTTMPDNGVTPSAAPPGSDSVPPPPGGSAATTLTEGQWISDAEARLKQLGYSESLVRTAMQRYQAGETLDAREYAVIETAINVQGAPPNGLVPKLAHAAPKKTQHITDNQGTIESRAHQD